jgi:hypothetical protein
MQAVSACSAEFGLKLALAESACGRGLKAPVRIDAVSVRG